MANNVASASSSDQVDLHLEFRTLSMLLNAVTTINRKQPSEQPQAYDQNYYTRAERTSSHDLALNAIATILVRGPRDVVATVAHAPSQYEPLHVYAMHDGEQADAAQGNLAVQSLPSKFALITNPDKRKPNKKFTKSLKSGNIQGTLYEKAKPGLSHYHLISDSHWNCLHIIADPLENHIATVVDFLERCSKTDSHGKFTLLHTFHRYIVASCWKKMRQRFTHRYSKAMFSVLTKLEPGAMQNFFQQFASQVQPSQRKDSALTWMLVDLEENGMLQSFLEVPLEGSVHVNSTDAKRLVDELRAGLSSQSPQGLGAYNAHTCFVFHLLLIAAVSAFRDNLLSLHGCTDAKDRETYAQQVLQFGLLLWRIAYSQMLTHHLHLLAKAGFLRTPVDATMRYVTDDKSPATSHPTGGDKDDDEDDDMAEDVERGGPDYARPGAAYKFRRWIQLLVGHWAALDILSKFKGMEGAHFDLIHVRRILERGEMASWDATIRRIASLSAAAEPPNSFDAQRAIDSFTRIIEDPSFDADIVKAFRKQTGTQALPPHQVKFNGNIHCEAALALLVEQSEQGCLVSDINNSTIGVSKLCCPGCWDTLNALRGDAKRKFKVRGCHGTVRTVDLPHSVPPRILNHMVELFRSRLRRELDIMVDTGAGDEPDRTSMESDCLSTASDVSSTDIKKSYLWVPPTRARGASK